MTVLGELSDRSPALATFNGRLFIAWKGNGNFHLNVMSSHDGVTFDHATKITFDEFTPVGPALAAFDGRLFLAWTGTDELALLNVMSSADGVTWGNKVTLREDSRYGPALCAFQRRLYMSWTGTDELSLVNVISSADGIAWGNKVTLREDSIATPALVSIHDPGVGAPVDLDILYLSWTGTDNPNHLNLLSSTDGVTFKDKMILNPTTFDGQEAVSFAGPALTVLDVPAGQDPGSIFPDMIIAWTEIGDDQDLRTVAYPQPNQDDQLQINQREIELRDTSIAAPALAQFGNSAAFIAWAGSDDDHHLNVSDMATLSFE